MRRRGQIDNRLTWVLRKTPQGEWKIIHEHTSAPVVAGNGVRWCRPTEKLAYALTFSQRISFDHLVLELDEDHGGFADQARAGGDILQGGQRWVSSVKQRSPRPQ